MGRGDRLAGRVVLLCFHASGKPQLTRRQCAAFGGALYFVYALCFAVLHVIALRSRTWPGHWASEQITLLTDRAVLHAIRFFVAVGPPLTIFGALAGTLRYQMRRGTEEERAGGGHAFQTLSVLVLIVPYLPLVIAGMPFMLFDYAFGTRLWNDGTSGWICLMGALLPTAALVFVFRTDGYEPPGSGGILYLSMCGADSLLSWLIFKWDQLAFLEEPAERALAFRFSLGSLVLTVLGLGTYLTLLAHMFDW